MIDQAMTTGIQSHMWPRARREKAMNKTQIAGKEKVRKRFICIPPRAGLARTLFAGGDHLGGVERQATVLPRAPFGALTSYQ